MRKFCFGVSGSWILALVVSCVLFMSFTPVWADEEQAAPPAEDRPTISMYVDFMSQYVFRGIAFSADSAVIQPSATLGYKGFSFNIWGNYDTNAATFDDDWNETDLTVSYSKEIVKNLTATGGYVRYVLRHGDDLNEFFAGLSYAFPWLTVGVTGYREFHDLPGWWMQIDLTRNFKLPYYDMSVDVGASFGYLDVSAQDIADFHSATLSAALNVPLGKYITISPKIGFAFPLTGDGRDNIKTFSADGDSTHIFGGLRVAASF